MPIRLAGSLTEHRDNCPIADSEKREVFLLKTLPEWPAHQFEEICQCAERLFLVMHKDLYKRDCVLFTLLSQVDLRSLILYLGHCQCEFPWPMKVKQLFSNPKTQGQNTLCILPVSEGHII